MPVTPGEYKKEANDDGTYRVVNTKTGEVHAKDATEEDADHQLRLLYATAHGWTPDQK